MRDVTRMASAWYGAEIGGGTTTGIIGGGETGGTAAPGVGVGVGDDPESRRRRYLLGQVSLMTWAFARSMMRHLSPEWEDERDFREEVRASRMGPDAAEVLIGAGHRPYRARYNLCVAIENVSAAVFSVLSSLRSPSRLLLRAAGWLGNMEVLAPTLSRCDILGGRQNPPFPISWTLDRSSRPPPLPLPLLRSPFPLILEK